jgi:hypothetical protein
MKRDKGRMDKRGGIKEGLREHRWFFNRDKASLDIFRLRDETLEESANLPDQMFSLRKSSKILKPPSNSSAKSPLILVLMCLQRKVTINCFRQPLLPSAIVITEARPSRRFRSLRFSSRQVCPEWRRRDAKNTE